MFEKPGQLTNIPDKKQEKKPEEKIPEDGQDKGELDESQDELESLRKADEIKVKGELEKIREKLGIEPEEDRKAGLDADSSLKPDTGQEAIDDNSEKEPALEEHKLEYKLAQDALNLIKESFDSATFENGGEVNTVDIASILETEMKAKPLNCDLYQDDYDADRFLDDVVRLPELHLVVEIAQMEMAEKLEAAKKQKIKEGDEDAEAWYQEEMKKLQDGYKEADRKLDEIIIKIEDLHDPEGAEKRMTERLKEKEQFEEKLKQRRQEMK